MVADQESALEPRLNMHTPVRKNHWRSFCGLVQARQSLCSITSYASSCQPVIVIIISATIPDSVIIVAITLPGSLGGPSPFYRAAALPTGCEWCGDGVA